MSKGLPRSMSRGVKSAPNRVAMIRQRVKVSAVALSATGAVGDGWATAVIGDLPEGNILLQGAMAYLQFTKTGASITATFTGAYAVGSAPTADATLSGAEVDIIPSTTLSAATAGVSPNTRGANATQVMLDNTDGSLELNVNLKIDDASISADVQALTVSGFVDLIYSVILDD